MAVRLAASVWLACWAVSGAAEPLTLEIRGVARSAEIHAPPHDGKPRPLVIALHGLGQQVESLRGNLGLDAVASRENFVAAYPQGMEQRWNYGRQLNNPMPEEADDVAFLISLIARLAELHNVDPRRVFLLGISNGALMAYRAACDMGGELAAVAAFISSMTDWQQADCGGKQPVPMFVLAGSADTYQGYAGATGKLGGRLVSVPDTFRFFRDRNRCSGGLETEELPDRDPQDGTTVTVFRAAGCESGAEVVFYRVNGGGHRVPAFAADTAPHTLFGLTNRDIDSAEEVWRFFRRFRSGN